MKEQLYTTEILRLAASLDEPQQLDREDGRAEVVSRTCGSKIALAVQLDDRRCVQRLSMTVQACAFGQASAALMARHSHGKTHQQLSECMLELSRWLSDERETQVSWPGIRALAPARSKRARHGAILLPFRAILAAMEDAR